MGNCFVKKISSDIFNSNYQMLYSELSEQEDLLDFLETKYTDFGILKTDILNYERDSETFKTLLQVLTIYKKTKLRYNLIERCLNNCPPHVKDALIIEIMKAKKILETLDVVFMKIMIGEFTICSDNVNQLLNKFSIDQTTLCDMEKINTLIDLDEENSKRLLTEIDPLLHQETGLYQALPNAVTDPPSEQRAATKKCYEGFTK